MYCIRHIQNNSGTFNTQFFFQVYASIFNHIQRYKAYLCVLRHYQGTFRSIPGYSAPCVTLHIHNLAIFWALAYLELEAYLKPRETLTSHTKNFQALFSHIQASSEPCTTLTYAETQYSESWNIQNTSIIASWGIFRTLPYSWKFTNIHKCHISKTRHIFKTL